MIANILPWILGLFTKGKPEGGRGANWIGIVGVFMFLAPSAMAWWKSVKLDDANSEIDRLQTNYDQCNSANETNQVAIAELQKSVQQEIDKSNRLEQQRLEAEQARRELAEILRIQTNAQRRELTEAFKNECSDYAVQPVCPAIAQQLRRAISAVNQD